MKLSFAAAAVMGLLISANAFADTCAVQIANQVIELPSMKPRPVTAQEQKIIDVLNAIEAGDMSAVRGVLAVAKMSPFVAPKALTEAAAAQALNALNQTGAPLTCGLLFNQQDPGRDIAGNFADILISQFLAAPFADEVTLTGSVAIQTVIAEQVPNPAQIDAWKISVPGNWFITIGDVEKRGVGLNFYVQSEDTGIALMKRVKDQVRGLPVAYYVIGTPVGL